MFAVKSSKNFHDFELLTVTRVSGNFTKPSDVQII